MKQAKAAVGSGNATNAPSLTWVVLNPQRHADIVGLHPICAARPGP
jgi:hypothetical protein